MKVGDAKGTPQKGDRILITGDHPDNGKAYQIKEIRENGWILTTNHRLFHYCFFELCPLPNSTSAQEWARVSHFQACSLEALNSSDSVRLTSIAQISSPFDSPTLPITETCEISQSETLEDNGETSTSLVVVHPVSRLVCKENAKEEMTQETVYPPSRERSQPCNLNSSVSKTSQDCSTVQKILKALGYISELSLISFPKSGTMRNGLLYRQDTLAAPSLEKDCFWLESPGALSSGNGRPPGQSRLEGQLKKLGVLERREVLNPLYLEKAYSLPLDWTNPQELRVATELLVLDEKPSEMHSILEWERSLLEEFSICPSCANQIISVSDGCSVYDSLLGVSKNSPSKNSNPVTPSNSSPSKNRRNKGEGSGSIHWKSCKRRDKVTGQVIGEYLQPWYHYEIWAEGDQLIKRTAYIPQKLLSEIERLEEEKAPIREILRVLAVNI